LVTNEKALLSARWSRSVKAIVKSAILAIATVAFFLVSDLALPRLLLLIPLGATNLDTREATGRIVCANCHLAAKPAEVEVPQSILPDTVFEAVVKFPTTPTCSRW